MPKKRASSKRREKLDHWKKSKIVRRDAEGKILPDKGWHKRPGKKRPSRPTAGKKTRPSRPGKAVKRVYRPYRPPSKPPIVIQPIVPTKPIPLVGTFDLCSLDGRKACFDSIDRFILDLRYSLQESELKGQYPEETYWTRHLKLVMYFAPPRTYSNTPATVKMFDSLHTLYNFFLLNRAYPWTTIEHRDGTKGTNKPDWSRDGLCQYPKHIVLGDPIVRDGRFLGWAKTYGEWQHDG